MAYLTNHNNQQPANQDLKHAARAKRGKTRLRQLTCGVGFVSDWRSMFNDIFFWNQSQKAKVNVRFLLQKNQSETALTCTGPLHYFTLTTNGE